MSMVKRVLRAVVLAVGFVTVLGASSAYASGFPMGVVAGTDVVVVAKFGSGFTSLSDAESVTTPVQRALANLNLSSSLQFFTPTQLAGVGITDADNLKVLVKNNYAAAGFSTYIFIDISRVSVPAAAGTAFGPYNLRLDLYVADLETILQNQGVPISLPSTPDGYTYLASIEVPESYEAMLTFLP
jgi:hypothetical protein